ncbi:YbaB/EbfC family nucleoid-associated protein [Streptomyces sp. NBC_00059]|uniref:YbaB/EbfC family nucleoid-associated protein n=1 Tax=Streptomyces sp. NBC_00059 TaxID=2975635 RepID=UPI0022501320|nr:YbaB/EbfC family nucleoid-associated protein [Streptomyces sp. NBC_00059]MCX5411562.1 YbaB/EbfC family nucleoid-associated protein [Streptomyces sp. NBC_00059]
MEQRIAKAMAELQAVETAVARAEEDLRDSSLTVRSRDRAVEVTVGPQGELTGLRFLDSRYRNMPAAQLAASVLEAADQARSEMAYRVREIFEPLTRPTGVAPEFGGFDVDWDRVLGPAYGGEGNGRGRSASDRLRDEIHDDSDDTRPGTRGGGRR